MKKTPSTIGFTLIETLVGVAIVSIATTGPLFTASQTIAATEIARDQLVASYLAQEAVEYVRAMRDNEYLLAYQVGGANVSSVAWNNFTTGDSSDPAAITQCVSNVCTFDPSKPMGTDNNPMTETNPDYALHTCMGTCLPLYLSPGNIYTQNSTSGTKTVFTRTVQATRVVSASDYKIVSTVTWKFHNITHAVTVTDHLTPWQ